jgi:hypothetical protein
MPSAADIKLDDWTSFLLAGEGGTKKTSFIGTVAKELGPAYIFDMDNGMAPLAGRSDIDYDLYKETSKNQPLMQWQKEGGWYEWGTAYPALLKKLNDIGKAIDAGNNKYKVVAIDSLTLLTDVALSYIVKQNGGEFKDGRQMWNVFLNNMSELFGQLTAWPVVKVLTAHIKKDDNLVMGTVEKLPNVPGQFSGKVAVYFDEVYYTEIKAGIAILRTVQDGTIKQAKSRKYNIPDGTPADFGEIMKIINTRRKPVAA